MIPLDWILIKAGYDAHAAGQRPGSAAPSIAEINELVEIYG